MRKDGQLVYRSNPFKTLFWFLLDFSWWCLGLLILASSVFGLISVAWHFISLDTCPLKSRYFSHSYWNLKELLLLPASALLGYWSFFHVLQRLREWILPNRMVTGRIAALDLRQVDYVYKGQTRRRSAYYLKDAEKNEWEIPKAAYEALQSKKEPQRFGFRLKHTPLDKEIRELWVTPA